MDTLLPLPIDLDELASALTSHVHEYCFYLDLQSGELLFLPEGLEELSEASEEELKERFENENENTAADAIKVAKAPHQFIPITPLPSWKSYNLMENFIETLPFGHARDALERAISKRKPFRRFKDTLFNFPKIQQAWFDYQEAHHRQWAEEWLRENGIRAIKK